MSKSAEDDSESSPTQGGLVPVVDRLVVHRHVSAVAAVDKIRQANPDADPDELANRVIRKFTSEMALSGAVTGGAAAAPVAGIAVAAASAGIDATVSVTRMGEMIMAIALVYGHDDLTVDERRTAVLTIMGIADGAAISVSGLAARAGSKGGTRLLNRIPSSAAGAGAGRGMRALSKARSAKGPWGLAALLPYGIGAGVGAAGSVLLTRAVGRAAKEHFSGRLHARLRAATDLDPTGTDPSGTDPTEHPAHRVPGPAIIDVTGAEVLDGQGSADAGTSTDTDASDADLIGTDAFDQEA